LGYPKSLAIGGTFPFGWSASTVAFGESMVHRSYTGRISSCQLEGRWVSVYVIPIDKKRTFLKKPDGFLSGRKANMCGRYQIAMEEDIIEIREILDEINERYKNKPDLSAMKTGEVFPTDTAPVLVSGNGRPQAELMRWGLTKWDIKGVIINARSETALEKKSFRTSLLNRRCVVPTTGFFEWQKRKSGKTKYLFRLPETKMLYLAGFYDITPTHKEYAIMTTAANPFISSYHDRMPLIHTPDVLWQWLTDRDFALEFIQHPCLMPLVASAV